MSPPVGFSHAVVAAPGRTIYLGGQAGHDGEGKLVKGKMVPQFTQAAKNVVSALGAAGALPEHLVSMHIYVTNAAAYRGDLKELGRVYREHFGDHYPAVALFEVQ